MGGITVTFHAVSETDLERDLVSFARRFQAGAPNLVATEASNATGLPAGAKASARRGRVAQRVNGDVQSGVPDGLFAPAHSEPAGDGEAVPEAAEGLDSGAAVGGPEQPADDAVEPAEAETLAQEAGAAGPAASEAEEAPQEGQAEISIDQIKEAAKALAAIPGKGMKAMQGVFLDQGVTAPGSVPPEKRAALLKALLDAAGAQ